MTDLPQIDSSKPPEQMAQAISMLAAGMSTRQIAAQMGPGWSQSMVVAFKNKSDVKQIVEHASRALLSRSLLPAIQNQSLKIENAAYHLDQANQLVQDATMLRLDGKVKEAKAKESEARAILKEAYGIVKLSDQAEARILETVGMAPTRATTPVYNFINAPTNQAIVSPEVLQLLGTAQSSNLGQLMGDEMDNGQHVEDVMDAEFSEIE